MDTALISNHITDAQKKYCYQKECENKCSTFYLEFHLMPITIMTKKTVLYLNKMSIYFDYI